MLTFPLAIAFLDYSHSGVELLAHCHTPMRPRHEDGLAGGAHVKETAGLGYGEDVSLAPPLHRAGVPNHKGSHDTDHTKRLSL